MSAYGVEPSLDGAHARVDRAKHHIASLECEIAAVLPPDRTISRMMLRPDFFSGGARGGTQYVSAPPILAILIGETIYNLRAALDYLVFELAHLDTGKPQGGTKFLIVDSEKVWHGHLPTPTTDAKQLKREKLLWLHKLSPAHQAALKSLQPCCGCKWTADLRELSNPDKHRRLLTVEASVNHSQGRMIAVGSGSIVPVATKLTSKVAFEDGAHVVDKLKLLQERVADVVHDFDPEF